jgi:hypothetical protein
VQPVEHKTSNTPLVICRIMLTNLQSKNVLSHFTGASVKMGLLSTPTTYSEKFPIKSRQDGNNHTVEDLQVKADCSSSVWK